MTTTNQYLILFSILIFLVFLGNYAFHYYFKKNHRIVLSQIKNEEYQIFKNISLYQFWDMGFKINKADIFILKSQIIIFLYNSNLNGLIKQAQPTLLLFENDCENLISKGISKKLKITKIEKTRNGISININTQKSIFNKSFRIVLKLNKNESNKIEKLIKENLYVT